MLKALKRVSFHVSDIDAARGWYAKVLSLQPVFETPVVVIFSVGACSLSLIKSPAPSGDATLGPEVYWEVDDIHAALRQLQDAGARAVEPVRKVMGILIAKVADPFGNIIGLTGQEHANEQQGVEHQASETAINVALCRALAAHDERPGLHGPDHLAELFLTDERRALLSSAKTRHWVLEHQISSTLYNLFIARTRFFDELFTRAIDDGTSQIVILGAGYDTRACRFGERLGAVRVFEVDIGPTQARKRAVLAQHGIALPEQLTLVEMNFKTDSYDEVLARAGYVRGANTLFLWEGVSYYLVEAEVKRVLRFVHDAAAVGSALAFDYLTEETQSLHAAEPFHFWRDPEGMSAMLRQEGLELAQHLVSDQIQQRFLPSSEGGAATQTMSRFAFIEATVG